MAKNLMPEVAKLLGVELEEEFNIVESNIYVDCMLVRYMLNTKGLFYYSEAQKSWQSAADFILLNLLTGKKTIKKLPWKPKANEDYFYVGWLYDGEHWRFCIETTYFDATETRDNLNVDTGNCFRTHEEAEAAQFDVFERLTGKKWEEVFGCKAGEAE